MANPPISGLQGDFSHSRSRRSLKYACQVVDGPKPILVFTCSIDLAGGMPPPAIKQEVTRKVLNFVSQRFPGQLGLKAIIIGRVDFEI